MFPLRVDPGIFTTKSVPMHVDGDGFVFDLPEQEERILSGASMSTTLYLNDQYLPLSNPTMYRSDTAETNTMI
ncbi:hypothetical protein DPMN_153680 [Dreissena polymorpha]|uniref:Uncharacterized protein n=1 Tax=Dreissena polymorpha TaxID=45954 RepID=A0A9D4FPB9_DREPO|nr:hypothetical protein DPMN_153680 [Dreissena polymorpha]